MSLIGRLFKYKIISTSIIECYKCNHNVQYLLKVRCKWNMSKVLGRILQCLDGNIDYKSSEKIAEELDISEKTVIRNMSIAKEHYNIISKCGKGGGYLIKNK